MAYLKLDDYEHGIRNVLLYFVSHAKSEDARTKARSEELLKLIDDMVWSACEHREAWAFLRSEMDYRVSKDALEQIDAAVAKGLKQHELEEGIGTIEESVKAARCSPDEQQFARDVDAVIIAGDIAEFYRLVPRIPGVSMPVWQQCRARLKEHFGAQLSITQLDRIVAEELRKPRAARVDGGYFDYGTEQEWAAVLAVLRETFGADWFAARQVADLARRGALRLPGSLANVPDAKGSLESSIGRAFNRQPEAVLAMGFDTHRHTRRWRIVAQDGRDE